MSISSITPIRIYQCNTCCSKDSIDLGSPWELLETFFQPTSSSGRDTLNEAVPSHRIPAQRKGTRSTRRSLAIASRRKKKERPSRTPGGRERTDGRGGVGNPPGHQAKPSRPPPRRSPRPPRAGEPRDSVDHFAKPSQPLPRPLSLATAGKEEARSGRKGSRQAEVRRHHSPGGLKSKPKSQSPGDTSVREAHKVRAGTR